MHRILFVADLNPNKFGSLEEMILFLGRELSRRGHKLILGVVASPIPEVAELFANAGIEVVPREVKGKPSVFEHIRFMRQLICERDVDLVHINFYGLADAVALGAYLTNARVVYTEHASGAPPIRRVVKNWMSKCLHFFIAHRVKKYIAVSDFVRGRLETSHHVGPDKSVTIYNGVNVERFTPRDRNRARITTGLPLDRKIILCVAMLIPEKGLGYLIDAASILVTENKVTDLCIAIAGEGQCREELERRVRDLQLLEHVIFLGRRSDVELLVAAANAVAVPAIWAESFGLIIAEAMAGGRPVVASRVGGIPELIVDGETGLLVEPGDCRGLAGSLLKLLTDETLSQRLTKAARAKTREQFNLSRQVDKLADLYDELLGR